MGSPVRIDPRRLLDLLAVARHGSFCGAAGTLNVSQPALSRSIAPLEREIGHRELERGRHGARLLPIAARFAAIMRALSGSERVQKPAAARS